MESDGNQPKTNRIYYAVCMTPQPEAGSPDDKRRESAEKEESAMREEWLAGSA